MTETDAAWAAGFIDGEGCLMIRWDPGHWSILLTVTQKRRKALDRLQAMYGGYITGVSLSCLAWRWSIAGMRRIGAVLQSVRPYLVEKSEEADILLAYIALGSAANRPCPENTRLYAERERLRLALLATRRKHNQSHPSSLLTEQS